MLKRNRTYNNEGFLELDHVSCAGELEKEVTFTVDVALLVYRKYRWHMHDLESNFFFGLQVLGKHHFAIRSLTQQLDLFVFVQFRFGFFLDLANFLLFFLLLPVLSLLWLLLPFPGEHGLRSEGLPVEGLLAVLRANGVGEVVRWVGQLVTVRLVALLQLLDDRIFQV